MLTRILFILSLCIFSLSISSCGDDAGGADCTSQVFNNEVNAAINAWSAAAQKWANDQTQSNCNDLKDAANDYLDAVESFEGCAGITTADYQMFLQAARDSVNQGIC